MGSTGSIGTQTLQIVDEFPDQFKVVALSAGRNLELLVDEKTVEFLASDGYEPQYGARPLKRVLRRKLENPLATELLEERFDGVRSVRVTRSEKEEDTLKFIAEN